MADNQLQMPPLHWFGVNDPRSTSRSVRAPAFFNGDTAGTGTLKNRNRSTERLMVTRQVESWTNPRKQE